VNNVRILCVSCNVKKSKTTAKLCKNSRNKRLSNRFQWRALCEIHAYTVTVSDHRSTRIYRYITNKLSIQCNLTAEIESVQDKYVYLCNKTYICVCFVGVLLSAPIFVVFDVMELSPCSNKILSVVVCSLLLKLYMVVRVKC
jgi:hypothetical protein